MKSTTPNHKKKINDREVMRTEPQMMEYDYIKSGYDKGTDSEYVYMNHTHNKKHRPKRGYMDNAHA